MFCVLLPVIILALCHAESHSARLTAFGKTPNNNQNNYPKKNTLGKMVSQINFLLIKFEKGYVGFACSCQFGGDGLL